MWLFYPAVLLNVCAPTPNLHSQAQVFHEVKRFFSTASSSSFFDFTISNNTLPFTEMDVYGVFRIINPPGSIIKGWNYILPKSRVYNIPPECLNQDSYAMITERGRVNHTPQFIKQ
jgi:hypothetical protein